MFEVFSFNENFVHSAIGGDPVHTQNQVVLMQCTGLEDKNGKLIYEGDILFEEWMNDVYPNGKFWVVKWNNKHAEFYIDLINPSTKGYFANQWHLARHDLDYEVIGNIYENPELLNKEE